MRQLKQPSEQLVYEFDFSARLGTGGTVASIAAATVTARGLVTAVTALTIGAQGIAGAKVRLRLDGGTDGETYLVVVLITDTAGQEHELDAEFVIVNFGFEVPSVTSPYLTAQAFVDRIGLDEAIRLTDTIGNGRIEVARLATALADAQADVDGYLAVKYVTPLATVPALITTIVYDLAVARLWGDKAPAGVIDVRDRAQQKLRDLAKGLITLPGAAALTPATVNDTPVLFVNGTDAAANLAGDRLFSRITLRGF